MSSPSASRFSLGSVVTSARPKPDRIILYGDPSWGKTTFATGFPSPIFAMLPGEDRLIKLINQGLVPRVPFFPHIVQHWDDMQVIGRELLVQPHDYKTLVIDTGNGLERLAREKECAEEYQGNWGETGFARFGQGEKVTADRLWVPFLTALERLRDKKRMRIVLLCHKGVVTVKNPEGGDYDKIGPALGKHTWSYTHKWSDMILYGSYEMQIAKDDPRSKLGKNKARGGTIRLLHCQPTAAFEAKNVHGLPPTIKLGNDPARAYDAFRAAFPRKDAATATPPDREQPPLKAGSADVPRAAASDPEASELASEPQGPREPGDEPEEA